MKCDCQWEVSASFYALISVLLFFDEQNIVPWALLACLLHEMGHLTAIYTFGGKVSAIRLSLVGAEIIPIRNTLFSYAEEILIILAGPLTNIAVFVCGLAFSRQFPNENLHLFCGLNLMLGLFNLLPVASLDGGRLLRMTIAKCFHIVIAEKIYESISMVFASLLLFGGIFLAVTQHGNITLVIMAVWLLIACKQYNLLNYI